RAVLAFGHGPLPADRRGEARRHRAQPLPVTGREDEELRPARPSVRGLEQRGFLNHEVGVGTARAEGTDPRAPGWTVRRAPSDSTGRCQGASPCWTVKGPPWKSM